MGYDDYEYFVRHDDGHDRPLELWRQLGERMEYLSLVDWEWHHHQGLALRPHPNTLAPVTPAEASALEGDRQGFVRYFVRYTTHAEADRDPPDPSDVPILVYRYRRLPTTGEIFGSENVWAEVADRRPVPPTLARTNRPASGRSTATLPSKPSDSCTVSPERRTAESSTPDEVTAFRTGWSR